MPWANTGSVGNGKLTKKINSSNSEKIRTGNIRSEEYCSHSDKPVSVKVEN